MLYKLYRVLNIYIRKEEEYFAILTTLHLYWRVYVPDTKEMQFRRRLDYSG
jgi:hypothetical protein